MSLQPVHVFRTPSVLIALPTVLLARALVLLVASALRAPTYLMASVFQPVLLGILEQQTLAETLFAKPATHHVAHVQARVQLTALFAHQAVSCAPVNASMSATRVGSAILRPDSADSATGRAWSVWAPRHLTV
jgi:hypothetical protein